MPRTPMAALRAAQKITLLTATLAVVATGGLATLAVAPTAAQAKGRDACANRLCTRDEPEVRSCQTRDGHAAIARCYINRAARHYEQPAGSARAIAWRETRYRWWVTNSSAHRGMYQFTDTLWSNTPYHARSPYSPRYASLAAMWMWKHGGYHHWTCC